jgi:hypothetical protein
MGARSVNFEDALRFGEEGEHKIGAMLIRRGNVVLPMYQFIRQSAPSAWASVNGSLEGLTLPDLLCWKDEQFFAEVKRKTRWVRTDGVSETLETGCERRLLDQYARVSILTSRPVYLFFMHEREEPTGVFWGELSRIRSSERIWDGLNAKTGDRVSPPMVLFPFGSLRRICV